MSWGKGAENNSIGWGQGDNNSIGWGLKHLDSWSGDTALYGVYTDPDAQAFITAASITDPTQQSAVNQLVVDLKAASLWTKMKAVYPFIGGSASTHKWNLKDPRDLDAAFRITFSGGITHNSNGITGNSTNAVGNTHLLPTNLTSSNGSFGHYSRTDSYGSYVDFGSISTNGGRMFMFPKYDVSGSFYATYGDSYPAGMPLTNTNSQGFYVVSRNGVTNTDAYKNGSLLNSGSQTVTIGNDGNFNVLASSSGTGSSNFSDRNIAFAFVADGLNGSEVSSLNTAVQTFQTTLSRNV